MIFVQILGAGLLVSVLLWFVLNELFGPAAQRRARIRAASRITRETAERARNELSEIVTTSARLQRDIYERVTADARLQRDTSETPASPIPPSYKASPTSKETARGTKSSVSPLKNIKGALEKSRVKRED